MAQTTLRAIDAVDAELLPALIQAAQQWRRSDGLLLRFWANWDLGQSSTPDPRRCWRTPTVEFGVPSSVPLLGSTRTRWLLGKRL